MSNLHAGEGLNDLVQVELEQVVVELVQVAVNDGITIDFTLVLLNGVLEQSQTALGVGFSNGAHGLELYTGVAQSQFAVDETRDVFGL